MKTKKVIENLEEQAKLSSKKGYNGDASEYYAKAKNLELLEKLVDKISGMEKQMKYMWQSLNKLELVNDDIKQQGVKG